MSHPAASVPERSKPSLRTELLVNLAVLAAGALMLAMVTTALAPLVGVVTGGLVILAALITADVIIFLAFGWYLITRLVTGPIDRLVAATGAVADGELDRRAPPAATRELDKLARSVNRMTDRLLDAQGALVRAEKLASVGRLAAGIAHEVGNPLSAAGNFIEVLRRRGADPEVIAATQRELGRIDAIVRSLLDYARPREGERARLDVADVVTGATELLAAQGVLRALSIAIRRAPGVPSVRGDRVALEQVFVNLLLNAVDAAGDGGRIGVEVTAVKPGADAPGRRRDDPPDGVAGAVGRASPSRVPFVDGVDDGDAAVQVVVSDSGPGVPEQHAVRVFDPFFTTKPPGQGTGLGLAIVQRTVHDHGGRVEVRRAREGGAAFVVTLPAGAA